MPIADAVLRCRVTPQYAAVLTPAKLNLYLEILGRRSDGYHELDTLYIAVDIYDRLVVRTTAAATDELRLSGLSIPGGGENLVLKALRLLRARRPIPSLIDRKSVV